MIHNDILRRLRYTFSLSNKAIIEIYQLADTTMTEETLQSIIAKEIDDQFKECTDRELDLFLDGFIISRRGKQENGPAQKTLSPIQKRRQKYLSNNMILRKLRIALQYKDTDIIKALQAGGLHCSKSEVNALFRNKDSRQYKPCGDQLLRTFLNGLAKIVRPHS